MPDPQSRNTFWRDNSQRLVFFVLSVVLSLFVIALVVYPLGHTILEVFFPNGSLTLASAQGLRNVRGLSTILGNTALYVVATLVCAVCFGTLLAWINERTDARIPAFAGVLPILPLMVPSIGSAVGYILLFHPRVGAANLLIRQWTGLTGDGPISVINMPGMVFVTAVNLVPLVYLVVSAALRNIDPALNEASQVCGASPMRTLRRVTLPIIKPSIASASLIVGVAALATFSVPLIIGTGAGITTLPVHIFRLFSSFPTDTGQALTLSIGMLIVIYVALMFQLRISRSLQRAVIGGKRSSETIVMLGAWRRPLQALTIFYMVAVFLPILGLIYASLQPYLGAPLSQFSFNAFRTILSNADATSALKNSFMLAAITATIAIFIAAVLVYTSLYILKRSGFVLDLVMMAPATIPSIVVAVAFLTSFSGSPFYLYGTLGMILLAFLVIHLPDASRAASSAFSQVNTELVEASQISGAGIFRTLRRVILPQVFHGLFAGWLIVFFSAVNEVTAAVFLGGLNNSVIGQVAIDYYTNGRFSQVAALTLLVTMITFIFILAMKRSIGQAYRTSAH